MCASRYCRPTAPRSRPRSGVDWRRRCSTDPDGPLRRQFLPGIGPTGVERPGVFVTIAIGEIPPTPLPERPHGQHRHRSRPRPLQVGLERCRGLRLQAQAGSGREHHPRDVLDEGRTGLDAQLPPQVLCPLPEAPHAQLGWGHVGDLLRRHLLLHQADRPSGRCMGRASRFGQGDLREARHPRGGTQVPGRCHRAVRVRGRVPQEPR